MDLVTLKNMVAADSDDEWLDLLLEADAEQTYELLQTSGVNQAKRKKNVSLTSVTVTCVLPLTWSTFVCQQVVLPHEGRFFLC